MSNFLRFNVKSLTFFAAITFYGLGEFLRLGPRDPDVFFDGGAHLGTTLIFAFWFLSVFSAGKFLALKCQLREFGIPICLALGTLFYSFLGMIVGHLGLIGETHSPYLIGFLFFFPFIDRFISKVSLKKEDSLLLILLSFIVFLNLIRGLYPNGDSDDLLYHLLGPRGWHEEGIASMDRSRPFIGTCSYWEYLLIWANALLAGENGRGLIEVQIFHQLNHLTIGFFGTTLALSKFLSFFVSSRWTNLTATLVGVSIPPLFEVSYLGKNDWGVSLWFFMGFTLLLKETRLKSLFLGGLLSGLAIGGKFTLLFLFLPLFIFWNFYRSPTNKKEWLWVAFGVLLGVSPILIRNFFWTGNPVFPTFSNLFPSPLMNSIWFEHQTQFLESGGKLSIFKQRVTELFFILPFASFTFFHPIKDFILKKTLSRSGYLAIVGITGFLLFCLFGGGMIQLRHAGPVLFVLGSCAVLFLGSLSMKRVKILSSVAMVGILIFSFTRVFPSIDTFKNFPLPSPTFFVRYHQVGGDSKAWLRMNAKEEDLVVSTGDNLLYYLSHLNAFSIRDHADLGNHLKTIQTPEEFLSFVHQIGARFILDSMHWHRVFWGKSGFFLHALLQKHPEAIEFQGKHSLVVNTEKLFNEVHQSCRRLDPVDPPYYLSWK